ncbi:YifB family Mg chelatase-like AAA ATPase [Patescibacteria group bacterium]|nr:YifB family Mg chelatase-like AAA ATPase [Patescibacteria group bacterium]
MSKKILTAAISGLRAEIVQVEGDSGSGEFGQIAIVGLPDTAISEARERVKSALKNCGRSYPRRKITINLAPAHLKKRGSAYDLPIALCILNLNNNFSFDFEHSFFCGELALDGEIRPLKSVLPLVIAAKQSGLKAIFVPLANAAEAALVSEIDIYPVISLSQTIQLLENKYKINKYHPSSKNLNQTLANPLAQIKGQAQAKRALTIAAAGGHNLLMIGPPGSGKSLLAQALADIMPDLRTQEQLEVAQIYSVAGEFHQIQNKLHRPPFRAPHHNASLASMLGGGRGPKPGEITLAHRGALFLDELPEFPRVILDSLRQPLEQRQILISRAEQHLYYPANFLLIAAMNPCPCGYFGDTAQECHCSASSVQKYQQKISGPIKDRFDLQLNVPRLKASELKNLPNNNIESPLNLIAAAQNKQYQRQKANNASVSINYIRYWQKTNKEAEKFALEAATSFNLSARAYDRLFRIGRSIADLENKPTIESIHIAEALSYRFL